MALSKEQYISLRKQGLNPQEIIKFEKSGQIPQNKTFGRKVFDFFTRSEQAFGSTLGQAASTLSKDVRSAQQIPIQEAENQRLLINRIIQGRKNNEDTSRLENQFNQNYGNQTKIEDIIPAIDKSAKQIFGEGLGVATDIAAFGQLPSLGSGIVKAAPMGFAQGAAQGAKTGLKLGAGFGTAQGVSGAMQEDKNLAGIVGGGVKGAITGAGLGVAGGAVLGGIGGKLSEMASLKVLAQTSQEAQNKIIGLNDEIAKLRNKTLKTGQQAQSKITELSGKVSKLEQQAQERASAKLATKTAEGTKDRIAITAIRRGLDDADVAAIKTASTGDKGKMREMISLVEKFKENKLNIKRPMDIVGETITTPIKSLYSKVKTLYPQLDSVAKSLKGKQVNKYNELVSSIDDDVLNTGASFEKARINFKGSDFEDVGGVDKIINNVYRRLKSAKDALDLHRLKKYIDNNVDYGKSAEGLTGQAEQMIKGWRRAIDETLDTQFKDYNAVNSDISSILQQLNEVYTVFGNKFNVAQNFAEIRAGQVASRILTKSLNRGEILNIVNNIMRTAKQFGYKSDDDIIRQIVFSDILEKIYGTQAVAGFQGSIERAITGSLMQTAKSGRLGIGELATKVGAEAIEKLRNTTPEKQIEILKKLIQ